MITRIECSLCGDPVEFLGTSLTLPFVCPACAATPQTPDNPVGLRDVGKISNPDKVVNAMELLNNWASHGTPTPTSEELPHDEATVENTTLLIADLEEQVRIYKRMNAVANVLVKDMTEQLQVGSELLTERDATISKLNDEIQSRENYALTLNAIIREYRQSQSALVQDGRRLRMDIFRLVGLYQTLKRENYKLIGFTREDSDTIRDLRTKNVFLKTRGFFGRMFNVEP